MPHAAYRYRPRLKRPIPSTNITAKPLVAGTTDPITYTEPGTLDLTQLLPTRRPFLTAAQIPYERKASPPTTSCCMYACNHTFVSRSSFTAPIWGPSHRGNNPSSSP